MANRPRKRIYDLVGESHYQRAIWLSLPGDSVTLTRERDNPHDPNAIAAVTQNGKLGYIARDEAAELAPYLDENNTPVCLIHEMRGGLPDYPTYGVRVSLQWPGEKARHPIELKPEQIEARQEVAANVGNEKSGCLGLIAVALLPIGFLLLSAINPASTPL
ncbi:MAG: HIRAN domain-containing protein [Pseudomonadota bacterium]